MEESMFLSRLYTIREANNNFVKVALRYFSESPVLSTLVNKVFNEFINNYFNLCVQSEIRDLGVTSRPTSYAKIIEFLQKSNQNTMITTLVFEGDRGLTSAYITQEMINSFVNETAALKIDLYRVYLNKQ
jgi:hypothetical protein